MAMSDTTYSIEHAKTGRSKCKRCKTPIQAGALRMCIMAPRNESRDYDLMSYHHVGCFRLPRKYTKGASALTMEEFLREHVDDQTDEGVLTKELDKIVAMVQEGNAAAGKKKKREEEGEETIMSRIKEAAALVESGASSPPKKKKKGAAGDGDDEIFGKYVESYLLHHKTKLDGLKDLLRWNYQFLTGKKEFVLFKVIDGETHGRLGPCGLCGGRLKLTEDDLDHVLCSGRFDEELQVRFPCGFKANRTDDTVSRLQPWHSEEPTEEEVEEMKKLAKQARGEGEKTESGEGKELLEKAADMNWKLATKEGIQMATLELVELVEGKIDMPEGKNPKRTLGPMIVANQDKTPEEIVQLVIEKFGFSEQNAVQAAKKEAAMEGVCENPKNAPLVMAFQELSQLYFKDGNRNAGAAYTKVVGALKNLELEVTADNAMSLCKGKTKVPGIGKGSAEKMKEFMSTGQIEKLEEKRAAHS